MTFLLPSSSWLLKLPNVPQSQARRRGGSRGSNEPPLEVNNGGLKTQTVDFLLSANSGQLQKYRESLKLLGEWVQVKFENFK